MKKLIAFLSVIVIAVVLLAVSKYFNCGYLRNYNASPGSEIETVKDKISTLEKGDIKNIKTLNHLADLYTRLGTIYIQKHLWDQAIENYQKGMKMGKDTPGVYYSIGLAYANRGSERDSKEDIDKAEFYYRKAIQKQDNYYDAENALAILLFYHKDEKEKALAIIKNVVDHNKNDYIARFTLGRFYYEMERLTQSLSVYEDLEADLEKLPPSGIIDEYKQNCKDNIQKIMSELRIKSSK